MAEIGIEYIFNLIRKIRDGRLDPDSPLTLEDLRAYRYRIIQKGELRSEADKLEEQVVLEMIRYYDRPYIVPDSFNDLKHVRLCIGVTDKMIESILPNISNIINYQNEWVCVYHMMIYRGWMYPVEFNPWLKWLNERLRNINKSEVLKDSASSQICKYLKKPEKYKWVLKDYLKAEDTGSQKTVNKFKRLIGICEDVDDIFRVGGDSKEAEIHKIVYSLLDNSIGILNVI